MTPEVQKAEYPYCVTIETSTGHSANIPVAFLTPAELTNFLQSDFKRLVQEAGAQGARIHVERAMAADYEKVLGQVAACLHGAQTRTEDTGSLERRRLAG